jgi:hypothetical protein
MMLLAGTIIASVALIALADPKKKATVDKAGG